MFPVPPPPTGVDGCPAGWFYVTLGDHPAVGIVPTFAELLDALPNNAQILVDIPIGLPGPGQQARRCDLEARQSLSVRRKSSVFPAPARAAVDPALSYAEASQRNRDVLDKGLSKQSWHIGPKIHELDQLLTREPGLQSRLRECHPEVCFEHLSSTLPLAGKKSRTGFEQRLAILEAVYPGAGDLVDRALTRYLRRQVQRDDVLDAFVAALCAANWDQCQTFPTQPELDAKGLRMEIIYWSGAAGA